MQHDQNDTMSLSPEIVHLTSRKMRYLSICVFLVGMHSLLLGTFIFLFTSSFYTFFFGVEVENYFFVKQAGLFLFCLSLFFLIPLEDLNNRHRFVDVIIVTKILAVLFLLMNMQLVPRPAPILIAAFGDASMAALLTILSHNAGLLFKKTGNGPLR